MTDNANARRRLPRWPLIPVAMSAMVSVWGGWVSLGALTGFGDVAPLPGIAPRLHVDLALTLPVSVEAYAAYAIAAWLGPWGVSSAARRFAMLSSVAALVLGASGQVSYHLLAAARASRAPWPVTVAVSCVPVVVIGCAAALTHLLRAASGEPAEAPAEDRPVHPLMAAVIARVAPQPAPAVLPSPEPAALPAPPPSPRPARKPRKVTLSRAEQQAATRERARDALRGNAALPEAERLTMKRLAETAQTSVATLERVKAEMARESAPGPVPLRAVTVERAVAE